MEKEFATVLLITDINFRISAKIIKISIASHDFYDLADAWVDYLDVLTPNGSAVYPP